MHLTTIENIKSNTRFVSKHLEDSRITPYIKESEQINIKPIIGDALYIDLLAYLEAQDKTEFPNYSILLNGGEYISSNGSRRIEGIIEALNYYTWARIVKNNNYTVTRFGLVNKEDQYSNNADLKERLVVEKDALSIADRYLQECIEYLNEKRSEFPLYTKGKQSNRLRISIIGD